MIRAAVLQPGGVLAVCSLLWSIAPSAVAQPHVLSSIRAPGDGQRVELSLEVGGQLSLVDQGKVRSVDMSVVAQIAYEERILADDTDAAQSLRCYELADATIKIDKGGARPSLRQARRLIGMQTTAEETLLYSPDGTLTRDELDLLDVPGNSLLIERLLPAEAVVVGQQWPHDDKLLARLLSIDAISQSDVTSTLKQLDRDAARCEIGGTLQGAIHGVSTEIEVAGKYKFDLLERRITWFALLIKERRSIGHVGPGIDAVAKLQMRIIPGAETPHLDPDVVAESAFTPSAELLQLEYTSAPGQFRLAFDRRWHVMVDDAEVLAMRMVDRGDLVAQCNVSPLPRTRPESLPTLARFQQDIKRSLDKHFVQFVQASESTSPRGYRVYRVVVSGEVAQLPIQWNYYLVADPSGRHTVLAFSVEAEMVELLGQSDAAIVASLEFIEPAAAAAAQPTLAR